MTPDDARQVFYELHVHQAELETQNEELRRTQEELEAARARYFDLYDRAPLGYCALTEGGLIQEANLTFANLLGTVPNALSQQRFSRFIFEEDQDILYLHFKQPAAGGDIKACELRMLHKDGTPFWVHLDSTAIQDNRGEANSRVVISDISERKRLEEEKRHLELHLQRAQSMESLGRLAGGVAHDMNNVLAAILGLASANLELQTQGTRTYQAFDTISKAAMRGGNTVKGLLTFAQQRPAEEREVDLNTLIRDQVRLLERTTLSKIRLEVDLASDLHHISGDSGALTHALMNLCINAVDAMPEKGTLLLRTRNMGDHWVEVAVEDSGTGMSHETLEKALDPFFTTKEVGKGTGLGLSMAFSTVVAHQGHMDIQSKVGLGTRIEILLPSCELQAVPLKRVVEPTRHLPHAALEVMVVDDDELIHNAMRTLLEALGHKVIAAWGGEEALAQLGCGLDPDVVILDMNMPGLDGAATFPRLRALRPNVPILIATGRVDQAALDLVSSDPLTSLMPKPFSMEELRRRLEPLQLENRPRTEPRRPRRVNGERRRADSALY